MAEGRRRRAHPGDVRGHEAQGRLAGRCVFLALATPLSRWWRRRCLSGCLPISDAAETFRAFLAIRCGGGGTAGLKGSSVAAALPGCVRGPAILLLPRAGFAFFRWRRALDARWASPRGSSLI
ncbi:uncharacterized protein A4U43_C01F36310 [Asparagus officinalis]|uniref:Uncharacterized protein n=1 Tax=Asparagus officinalis TaxID=4686 RepID=A0A5P1FX96_ASPOF|nr:uncharacterized protein A4U43_C01F36310 [Asparagus officinalis]